MFNLNVNWLKIIKENTPSDSQTPAMIDILKALVSPFVAIYVAFIATYQDYIYKVRFTGQVIYLEKVLNDKFSPISGGIYIVDGQPNVKKYTYRRSEAKPPQYRYRRWKSVYNYAPGDFAVFGNVVYRCLVANNNVPPPNATFWVYHKDVVFKRRRSEFNIQFNFIVKVPAPLVFDPIAMSAEIDYYRLAGKRYKIETY